MEKIDIIEKDFLHKCTGCGACKNACPVGAIEMVEGYHTFLYPKIDESKCIHCKKCVLTCPVNKYDNINSKTPELFAVRASDEIRKQSSSGGMFYVFAEAVIKNQGTCYGASLTPEQKIEHIRISTLEEIKKCQGSKYVQSNTKLVYQEAKKDLDDGKLVLFTGCPCQIVGLKNYLAKPYENLITIDIICHGVPSQKEFDLYLADKDPDKINDVLFRDKENGWRADILTIKYNHDNKYMKSWKQQDEFEVGFQENIILRDSCQNCKFCEMPRTGDLSIGDFWGIEKYMENDGKGTSMLFVNNEKGKLFFDKVINNFTLVKKMDIPFAEIKNRIRAYYPHHENKDLFFDSLKNNSFAESIKIAKNGVYDVAIVGIPTVENFGGSLTYVALYHTVKELGFSSFMIERPTHSKHPPAELNKNYYISPFGNAKIVSNIKTKSEYQQLSDKANCFLVGSDQMFHHNLYNNFSQFVTLDWVKDNKRKVAYAASFGHDEFTGDENERAEMSYYMKKFDAFSVRESSGVELAKNDFGVDAIHALDPVFLCNPKIYEDIANNAKQTFPKNYISSYILDPNNNKAKILDYVEKKLKLPSKIYSEMALTNDVAKTRWNKTLEIGNINDRMACIVNSDFIVTDSFHGTCFAIIMKKPFIAIKNAGRGVARFESLLGKLGLMNRLVDPNEDLSKREDLFEEIDYNSVYKVLNKEIKTNKTWLLNNLKPSTKKSYSTEDILLKKLKDENNFLKKQLNFLMSLLNVDYVKEYNLIEYISKLNKNKHNLLISISAKDTPGMSITREMASNLQSLGIKTDLTTKHWCGYSAIIYKGVLIDEKCVYQEEVASNFNDSTVSLNVISAPLHKGNRSIIEINNVDYSINSRGLNFVIYDLDKKQVTDSVCFDTHDRKIPALRK